MGNKGVEGAVREKLPAWAGGQNILEEREEGDEGSGGLEEGGTESCEERGDGEL